MASSFLAVAATFTLAAQPYSSTGLPNFPKSWSVRESQHAKVEGTPPTSSHQRNCSVTAYVDDRKERTSYHFYEPNRADRGYVYFVQPGAK
eukprot:gene26074-30854_t